jgi:hypothetical protein
MGGGVVTEVDVYAVGLLNDLKRFRRDWWVSGRWYALRHLARRVCWRTVGRARRGDWRAVRMYFNGYLAECNLPCAERAGHGWTRTRARLDLARHVAEKERSSR